MTTNELRDDVLARIQNYLENGGFFNPELMEHDKVRALIIDARAALGRAPDPWAEADAAAFESHAKGYDEFGFAESSALCRRAAQRARGVPVTEDGR